MSSGSAHSLIRAAAFGSCLMLVGPARVVRGVAVTVIIESKGERPPAGEVRLIATPKDQGAGVAPQEHIAREPLNVLDLRPGLWIIRPSAGGFWGEPREVRVDQGLQISVELWPATEIRAEITSDVSPRALTALFRTSSGSSIRLAGEETCPVEARVWRCALPSGVFDLNLRAEGQVPHYRWGVVLIEKRPHDIGRLALVQGASISGFVAADSGSIIPSRCRVQLDPERSRAGAALPLEVGVNGRGFFQFSGTPPGGHVVVARCEGFEPASRAVTVRERSEASLKDPLSLRKASFLELTFTPATDPSGLPWVVEVAELSEGGRLSSGPEPAGRDGVFRKEGLSLGVVYQVVVTTASRQPWWAENLALSEENRQRTIALDFHQVEGTIRIGKRPLSAAMWFGRESEALRFNAKSDQDGHFKVKLPRLGLWPTTVEADEPAVKAEVQANVVLTDGAAGVEIALPSTSLSGAVVEESGNAVDQAVLAFSPSGASSREILYKSVPGSFRLEGMPAGNFVVRASSGRRSSKPVDVKIEEDFEGPPLTLVLRKSGDLVIRVVGPLGEGVPFALVIPRPTVEIAQSYGLPKTDASGRLTLPVPPEVTEMNFVVVAPGFALRMFRASVTADEPLIIPVSRAGGSLEIEMTWERGQGADAKLGNAARDIPVAFFMNQGWAIVQPGKVHLPIVEPGLYAVCAGATCDSGVLSVGQTLVLRPFRGKTR